MRSVWRTASALAVLASALVIFGTMHVTATSSSVSVTPTSGPVGTKITVSGQGLPSDTDVVIDWSSANVSWVLSGNPTQVTGINLTKTLDMLTSTQTDATGSFSVSLSIPEDNGGSHLFQVKSLNGTPLGSASFVLEPSFAISSTSGVDGSPIVVTAHGLGDSAYSTSYHVIWDNKYVGYMTGVTTHGEANFTLYAVGSTGTHYLDIYQGYPGPAYLNAEQIPYPSNLESYYPPLIPFHAKYTITSGQIAAQGSSSMMFVPLVSLALSIAGISLVPLVAFHDVKKGRQFSSRAVGKISLVVIAVAVLLASSGLYLAFNYSSTSSTTTNTTYVPQITVVRPTITVPETLSTTGPRISVSPNAATVGTTVNVTGNGFTPNTNVPLSWSTEHGSNIQGYSAVYRPLRNVTTNSAGAFTFTMKVPVDLEGDHFIAAGNMTPNSNATLYVERDATITPNNGPQGTQIVIQLLGTGWDYNTNIVAVDYDNSFVGYACGFSSQGNITVVLTATGSPGIHTIDLYGSIWLGPAPPGTIAEYRYPILTPYDHPEKVPSFHFSFLITSVNSTSAESSIPSIGALSSAMISCSALGLGCIFLIPQLKRSIFQMVLGFLVKR